MPTALPSGRPAQMRHVLHVVSGLRVGGAEMALYRLVLHSRGSGYIHTVVALTPEGDMAERFRSSGVELIVLDFRRSPVSQYLRLLRLMRLRRPDIVQTWLYHADLFGGLAARLAGIRNVIWGVHTTYVTGGPRATAAVRWLCGRLSRWVPSTIVCVAEAARREHVRIGYDAGRVVVVPNGFDLSFLVAGDGERERLRRECGFAEDDVVIGTVGRFSPDKDHGNFIQAAALLARRNASLRFLMVGKGLEPGNAVLMNWIRESGCAKRFVLLGERHDIPACLAGMDVFCLSSRTEAFPLVVGEAMAMGLPCVSTDVGDVSFLLGGAGIVVPKENPEAMAQAVAQLLSLEPASRRKLGEQASARIRAEFAMERARERIEGIYETVLQRRSV
ncbi:MAG TPA: glycosyltransferase [Noviherbaspirillum sp.]|nr:glycosyltransferase [Noviherbaspirillum sp.]